MKLTPASRAFATIRDDVASSVGPPNIMVPKQIGEIFRPLRPRLRYCIGWVLMRCCPSFRGDAKHRTRNLEIPRGAIAPLWSGATAPSRNDSVSLRASSTLVLQYLEHTARH